ncbi:unnamed protein product [Arctia plantaginis]|uniref:Ig-like domain-containing protein n=1 Tax=Arctia plantaginis TaxID=874455 RepID=A0A8S1AYX0_ARCPL|nr:unnamed protein product [Arctia plantaginis]
MIQRYTQSNGTEEVMKYSDSCLDNRTYNTKLSFTCEVSTEGPRFAVAKQTKNLTIAVTLKEDPVILGVPGTVQLGEDVLLNCTSQPAMPPANIMWYIDGRPEVSHTEPWLVNNTQVSAANEFGLRSSWRSLKLRVATTKGYMALRCEATQPTFPPYTRSTNKTLEIARSPHLSMFTAAGLPLTAYAETSVLKPPATLGIRRENRVYLKAKVDKVKKVFSSTTW